MVEMTDATGHLWTWARPRDHGDVLRFTDFLREEQGRTRKALLALCAICRNTWDYTALECNRKALEASEDFADGMISQTELEDHWRATRFEPVVYCEWMCSAQGPAETVANLGLTGEADEHALAEFHATFSNEVRRGWWRQGFAFAMDVLDFAFRPVAFDSRWRTETAVALAAGIYDGRHFDRLPVLADALEDAGCDSTDLLAHLRGPGPHARGCWAVDAVLGRE